MAVSGGAAASAGAIAPRARVPWALVAAAAVLQTAALPPAWFPGAEWLIVPGLAVQFALANGARRPVLASYLYGVLHIGAFSWSLRHVLFAGWVAIALVGGLYFALAAVAARSLRARCGSVLAFALAIAGACWLRAHLPEIWYPHGQPCHVFWAWPRALGAVVVGGETLANALLAVLGAVLAQAWTCWRVGAPARGVVRMQAIVVVSAIALVSVLGMPARPDAARATVAIAAIEPGVHPTEAFADLATRAQKQERWRELFEERWLQPLRSIAAVGVASPPVLVLWPESSVYDYVDVPAVGPGPVGYQVRSLRALDLAPGTRLCLGAAVHMETASRETPAALLVDERGCYLAHQEKRRLVPAGEFLPLLGLLPTALAQAIRAGIASVMGDDFEVEPGRAQPPLQTAQGVPFGVLICFENAFADTAAEHVERGARFLAVLSNEAWYRGGGELDQLAAMTVLRALETGTPIVRCTTDGLSLAVDADGRILAELSQQTAPSPAARILRVDLPLGPGRLPPMTPLHRWFGWLAAAALLGGALHAAVGRARLRWLRQIP